MEPFEQALEDAMKIIIEQVRDDSILYIDSKLFNTYSDFVTKKVHEELGPMPLSDESKHLVSIIVPLTVDATIGGFLRLFEHKKLLLKYQLANGEEFDIADCSDGLVGSYYAEDWIERFSKERRSFLTDH